MNQTNIPPVNQANRPLVSVGNGNQVKWGDFPVVQQTTPTTTGGSTLPTGTGTGQMIWWNGTGWVVTVTPTTGSYLYWNGTAWANATAGDATKIQGYSVNVTGLTTSGQMLFWTNLSGTGQWVTTYVPTGTGSMLFWNGTSWESTSTTGIATGNVLVWNNTTSKWVPGNLTLAGDVTGSSGANTVVKLQNYPVNVTGLTGSGGFMYYTSTGSQFVFSGSPTGAGSIMYWNGSGYVSTAPSSTGVLQWNSGSSTYSYVAVGGSTPNNDAWSANPQTTAQAIPYNGTSPFVQAVNSVAFNNGSYTFSKFLVTWSAAQSNAASGTSNLVVNIVETGGILVGLYTVGQVLTTTRNTFSGSFVYTQATPASSTMTLQFSWQSNITGQLNWSNLSVVGIY